MNVQPDKKSSLLWLAALGVVFGDIGTSPLYAFQSAISLTGASEAVAIASLIIWTVFLVVSMKYAFIMMKEDYKGEGGVFALFSLLKGANSKLGKGIMVGIVAFGAALMLGDGTLTPAISVLSAVQGLVTVHSGFAPYTVVATCAILILLFAAQRFGTGSLGSVFGPVMILWFAALAVMGALQIVEHPDVLWAFDPRQGIGLLARSGWHGFFIVGAVALAVTGAEALYADLSSFGRTPILTAWYYVTFPALLLNYLGQAAYVMHDPSAAKNPSLFFLLCPVNEYCPVHLRGGLVILATAATVIASQALISAVFTLVRQAKTLNLLPPFFSKHTSSQARGQIYIPSINFLLGATCVLLILVFKTSNSLANAYGVAVTGAMAVTTIIWGAVMFSRRDVPKWRTALIIAGLLSLDLSLFASCLTKFFQGGYMPFGIALIIMGVMFSWYRGRELLGNMMTRGIVSTEQLGKDLEASDLVRVGGSRVFLSRESTPEHSVASILEFHRRTKDISENIVILMLPSTWANPHQVAGIPEVKKHEGGLWEITVPHGYMVDADAPGALRAAVTASGGEFSFDPNDVFFIFPKEYLAACSCYLPRWQKRTYNFLARNVGIHVNLMRIPPKILIGYLAYIELKCPARVCCKDSL